MSYEPKTDKTRWVRDQVLQALRAASPEPLNTTQLVADIGVRDSTILQGTMLTMEKHGEIERFRTSTAAIYYWLLGPDAPAPLDVSSLTDAMRGSDE